MKRWFYAVLVMVFLFTSSAGTTWAFGDWAVHFIDVGQAEATLLQGQGFNILIDAANPGETQVLEYLQSLGVNYIDLLVITHPHSDHIGQAAQILRELTVGEVWMSGYEHTTNTFENLLDAILESNADYYEPRTGDVRSFGGLILQVLNPPALSRNIHETCIILRASYGEIAFLFTGDAERGTEESLVKGGLDIQANVLQLGHHGSRTSSSLEFLLAVDPEIAVYSAGQGNDYGHPHREVLDRLKILEIPTFGTDRLGTIVIRTDGTGFELETTEGKQPFGSGVELAWGVDLNSASFEELQRIVHIGPARAQQILEERAKRPFSSVDELRTRIGGISEQRLQDIKTQGLAYVKE